MTTKFKQTLVELQDQLQFINLETDDIYKKSLKSVEMTAAVVRTVKKQFLKTKTTAWRQKLTFSKI